MQRYVKFLITTDTILLISATWCDFCRYTNGKQITKTYKTLLSASKLRFIRAWLLNPRVSKLPDVFSSQSRPCGKALKSNKHKKHFSSYGDVHDAK